VSNFKKRLTEDAKRLEALAKQAEVTAVVAAHAFNPLAGPAAQQADLTPAKSMTEVSQEIQREQQHDLAHADLRRREDEAGELRHVRQSDPAQTRQATSREKARRARRSRER
jgi:hypothetical protein